MLTRSRKDRGSMATLAVVKFAKTTYKSWKEGEELHNPLVTLKLGLYTVMQLCSVLWLLSYRIEINKAKLKLSHPRYY